jgi:hypothetical protein
MTKHLERTLKPVELNEAELGESLAHVRQGIAEVEAFIQPYRAELAILRADEAIIQWKLGIIFEAKIRASKPTFRDNCRATRKASGKAAPREADEALL